MFSALSMYLSRFSSHVKCHVPSLSLNARLIKAKYSLLEKIGGKVRRYESDQDKNANNGTVD
jgi:hypothetical protein